MIFCYQVTELFCSTYGIASALLARSPRNLGSLAYFAISVFWEVNINTVLPRYHFGWTFRIWILRSECWHFYVLEIFCELLLTNLGDLTMKYSVLDCCPCSCFCFFVFVGSPWFLDAWAWVSSLRCIAGLGEIPPDVSCGNDEEDELVLELEEPVDPGTTISTKFSVLHRIILPFLVSCGFWPTLGQEACLRRFAPPRRAQSRERILWLPHVFALLHWLW